MKTETLRQIANFHNVTGSDADIRCFFNEALATHMNETGLYLTTDAARGRAVAAALESTINELRREFDSICNEILENLKK